MIIPLADVITPNRYEAKALSGISNTNKSAKKIQSMGAKCVIITGATSSNSKISDFVLDGNMEYVISGKKFLLEIMVVGVIILHQLLYHLQREIQFTMQ